jgi:hypothetical protein
LFHHFSQFWRVYTEPIGTFFSVQHLFRQKISVFFRAVNIFETVIEVIHDWGNIQLGTKSVLIGHSSRSAHGWRWDWMVVKRRPTCKPGEPIFDYPFMIGTEVVSRYLVSKTMSARLWSLHSKENGPHIFRIWIDDWCSWFD